MHLRDRIESLDVHAALVHYDLHLRDRIERLVPSGGLDGEWRGQGGHLRDRIERAATQSLLYNTSLSGIYAIELKGARYGYRFRNHSFTTASTR